MGEAKRRKLSGQYPSQSTKAPRKQQVETVEWEVVGDLARHPRSQDVLRLLDDLRENFAGMGGGNQMVVVLEDPAQQPVIRVQTLGLGAFMDLIGGLQSLGLVDRLESSSQPERGIDAAFS